MSLLKLRLWSIVIISIWLDMSGANAQDFYSLSNEKPDLDNAPRTQGQAYIEALPGLPTMTLLERWARAEMRKPVDQTLVWAMEGALAYRLTLDPDARGDKYAPEIESYLENGSMPDSFRASLASSLAQSETMVGAMVLLRAANKEAAISSTPYLISAVGEIGETHRRKDVLYPEDLSPLLEEGLAIASQSKKESLETAIACSLANIGAPAGVKLAMQYIGAQSSSLPLRDSEDQKLSCQMSNPKSIPLLAETLRSKPPADYATMKGDAVLNFAAENLLRVRDENAVESVLKWLSAAPDATAPIVKDWFFKANSFVTDRALSFLAGNDFKSTLVKDSLRQQLQQNVPQITYDGRKPLNNPRLR